MKPCKKCGEIKPLASFHNDKRNRDGKQGQCKECRNQRIAQWQKQNPERLKVAMKKWRTRNPEKVRDYSAKYWAENTEVCKAKRKEWMTPERNSYYLRLRRARVKGAKGSHTLTQLKARIAFYGHRCYLCGGSYDTIDHVIPVSAGGTNWPANLRPACRSCNSRKGKTRL